MARRLSSGRIELGPRELPVRPCTRQGGSQLGTDAAPGLNMREVSSVTRTRLAGPE